MIYTEDSKVCFKGVEHQKQAFVKFINAVVAENRKDMYKYVCKPTRVSFYEKMYTF